MTISLHKEVTARRRIGLPRTEPSARSVVADTRPVQDEAGELRWTVKIQESNEYCVERSIDRVASNGEQFGRADALRDKLQYPFQGTGFSTLESIDYMAPNTSAATPQPTVSATLVLTFAAAVAHRFANYLDYLASSRHVGVTKTEVTKRYFYSENSIRLLVRQYIVKSPAETESYADEVSDTIDSWIHHLPARERAYFDDTIIIDIIWS